jgi:hypothetical protein
MTMIKKVGMLWRVEWVDITGVVKEQTYPSSMDAERRVDQLLLDTEAPDHRIFEIRTYPIHVYNQKGQERIRYVRPV